MKDRTLGIQVRLALVIERADGQIDVLPFAAKLWDTPKNITHLQRVWTTFKYRLKSGMEAEQGGPEFDMLPMEANPLG